jgi:hypothetical protein
MTMMLEMKMMAWESIYLGIWMSLQSLVERRHQNRPQDIEALATTVQEAWADLPADTIQWVFNRIPVVHQLIVECGGDNVNVEERRGHCNIAAALKLYFSSSWKNMREVGSLSMNIWSEFCPDVHSLTETHSHL